MNDDAHRAVLFAAARPEEFLAAYFGKRDDETLHAAIGRVVHEPNPIIAAFSRRKETPQ